MDKLLLNADEARRVAWAKSDLLKFIKDCGT